jgi:endoglucanase
VTIAIYLKIVNRRDALKSLGLAMASLTLPGMAEGKSGSQQAVKNPSWYGFNLLEYFSTDPDWMKYFPYRDDGMFQEDDFRWIGDWGFNWVRLPMDYRFWTDSQDLFKIREEKVLPIDRAIRLGEKYGIHVNVCLHRAPGYCILDGLNEALTGIQITKEKSSFLTDQKMRDAFVYQWTYFARRYKGISSQKLSFNLVNEPMTLLPAGSRTNKPGKSGPVDPFGEEARRREADYTRVARAAFEGITKQDPQRLCLTDGYNGGTAVIPDLLGTGMMQSCHTYYPGQLTHYQCEWARGSLAGTEENPVPTWPYKDASGTVIVDRARIEQTFQPWGELAGCGVPIHFGEMGCYKHTPPEVILAWFEDTLSVLHGLHSGWALWNFRGPFGVLDTERAGTKFENWHGHQLDRPLLRVLQKWARA